MVNADAFMRKDARVDFDVNNLKLVPGDRRQPTLVLKNTSQAGVGSVDRVVANIQRGVLLVLKPYGEVAQRVQKMERRGWQVRQVA